MFSVMLLTWQIDKFKKSVLHVSWRPTCRLAHICVMEMFSCLIRFTAFVYAISCNNCKNHLPYLQRNDQSVTFKHMQSILSVSCFLSIKWLMWPYFLTLGSSGCATFRDCSRMGRGQKGPLPKICHLYPTKMKFGTVIL